VSRIDELERRIEALERHLMLDGARALPAVPYAPAPHVPVWDPREYLTLQTDCGCQVNNVCMNVACPRRTQVTFATNVSAARAQ
jgi:hypothetical protein